jgi:protocatechuate 3,4-dioxygenase beta subunit
MEHRSTRAVVLVMLALATVGHAAQQRPARDGVDAPVRIIRGQVRSDDDSRVLLRKARVTVAGVAATAVFTNQDGRFEIAVPGSTPVLRVTKAGFGPTQIPLTAVSDADTLDIRMARGAAITGRVVDELGGPVVAIGVRVRRMADPDERGVVAINAAIETDDLGEFRIGSLPAGNYELSLDNRQVRVDELAMPGTLRELPPQRQEVRGNSEKSEKASVRLRAGDEVAGTLYYVGADVDARAAAEYVAGYEAGSTAVVAVIDPATGRARPGAFTMVSGTATVSGRVTGPNGRGVSGAIVRLNPASAGRARLAATNTQGQFTITGVAAGAYRLVAAKTGFLAGEHGQTGAGRPGIIVSLRERQRLDRADISVSRGAVVTGIVADTDGEPLEGLAMHVWRLRYWNGRRISEAATEVSVRRTDDRGHYRLHGLQPGTYYVVASDDPSGASREVTAAPRSYYPAASVIGEASTIRVDVGVDAEGTHLTFNPARTFRIAGRAEDSEGNPLERPLILAGSTRAGVAIAAQMAMMSGKTFSFDHVPPGSYVLHATQHRFQRENGAFVMNIDGSGRPTVTTGQLQQEFATQFVDVTDGDVTQLNVITSKGTTISGRILVEGDRFRDSRTPLPFDIVSADPDFAPPPAQFRPWTIRVNPDSSFQIDGLHGPVRFTSSAAPVGWFLKSVDIAGRNAADEPVVLGGPDGWRGQVPIVFSSAGADIAGRVVNGRNEPVGTYVAIVFPVDRQRWHIGSRYSRTAYPDEEARFTLGTLPPGDYFVAAVDALPGGAMEDPELLARLTTVARRVALAAGERMVADLPLVRLPP